jgi:DNA helicase II / ATP-dependent DNA helicase PcrA
MQYGREKLLQKYFDEYSRLNKAQQEAVDKIEGPVMVIAGPGTGKTQILAARIGKILLETDVAPHNILCLTYTDAGTIAMRKRLLEFIGSDAYKVNIYTFHAFCNDVIQDNLSLFEKNAMDPISELDRIHLFKQLIDQFPKGHPLKRYRSDVYYEISNLQSLFSVMKREGWSPDYISTKIDEYLNDLPNRDGFTAKRATGIYKKGDLRQDKIDEEKERMGRLRAAVNEFENFQQLMREQALYDFDDMINWVIEKFQSYPNLLAEYQERYQYILVDEYQDTSGTQNRIVELLTSYWDEPNIFVVGDDDQSIYRFQGASVENMLGFAKLYERDLLKIVLTDNYRSTQPILDISKTLIDKNEERLVKQVAGLSKHLQAANEAVKALSRPPVIREYESQRHEMAGITLEIAQLVEQGIAPQEIAVIYRENKYGDELTRFFRLRGIPVFSRRSLNVLDIPFAANIIQVLRYIAMELEMPYSGDELLFEILHYKFFGIKPIEIAKISVAVDQKRYNEKTSIRQYIQQLTEQASGQLFPTAVSEQMIKASNALENLIAEALGITLQQLFEQLTRETGVLGFIMQSPDKIWLLQVLTEFFDYIKEQTHRNPDLSLKEFVQNIDLMQSNELPISITQFSGSDKGVNLLTVHGSKGLEFKYVYMAGCNSVFWEKKRKPASGYKYPDTLFSTKPTGSDEEELRRLFYVAITRSATNLYICYPKYRNDGREMERSMFVEEIRQPHQLPVEHTLVSQAQLMEFEALQFADNKLPEIEKAEYDFIAGLLDKFVLSVTALNNYIACPLQFYYRSLVRVPTGRSENTEFGSAVHFALRRLFEKMGGDPNKTFPSAEDFVEDFKWYMQRHRESFSKESYARRMEYGEEILTNYYAHYHRHWNKITVVERSIKNVAINGVPIKGQLDKLEFDGNQVNVVDYKTGNPDNGLDKLKGPNDKKPEGGDYWRQAVFYKILVDNDNTKKWQVMSTEFDFIEPDKKKQYRKEKVSINAPDVTTVTQQIVNTWQKICNHDFYIGCGKEECYWCNFVKDNNLAVKLHEAVADEEEEG